MVDVISAAKFYGNRLRGFGVTTYRTPFPSPQTPFPIAYLTLITLTTVSALHCCTV